MARTFEFKRLDGTVEQLKYQHECYAVFVNPYAQTMCYPEGHAVFRMAEDWAKANPDADNWPTQAAALFHGNLDRMPVDLNGWSDGAMAFPAKFDENPGDVYVGKFPRMEFPQTGGYSLLYHGYQRTD